MSNRNRFRKLFLILLIILIGSFSFAEGPKNPPSNTTNPQQQDCTKDNKKNSNPDTSAPALNSTTEKKTTNPESLTPPAFKFQDNTKEEG